MPELLKPRTIQYQRDSYWGQGLLSIFAGPYSVDKVNEINKEVIETNATNWNNDAEQKLSIARERFRNIPSDVFNYLIEARKAHLSEFTEKLAEAHKVLEDPTGKNKRGIPPHPNYVRAMECEAEYQFNKQVDEDVKQKYYASRPNEKHEVLDDQIKRAKVAAGLEGQASGSSELLDNAIGSVYDKKRGGVQWGGIVGGVVGYIASSMFGAGGMIGTILAVLMTGIGIYMGNKVADNYKNDTLAGSAKPPAEKTPGRERKPEQGQEPEKAPEAPAPLRSEEVHRMLEKEEIERAKVSKTADRVDLGSLKPQVFMAVNRSQQGVTK